MNEDITFKKEGKNKMKVQEFIIGNKLEVGTLINEWIIIWLQ